MDTELGQGPYYEDEATLLPVSAFAPCSRTSAVVGPSESSIFRVHKKLREVNEKAYEPDIVSIGPYHRGKPGLRMMEVQKRHYLKLFLEQRNKDDEERYLGALRQLEEKARRCYAESISLTSDEFVEMMLLDGFFIIEVILTFGGETITGKMDPIFNVQWMVSTLQRDLILFENQLPLFILIEILSMVDITLDHKFFKTALTFFEILLPSACDKLTFCQDNLWETHHLLEFVHKSWLPLSVVPSGNDSGRVQERASRGFIPSTTELQKAGVKLEAVRCYLFDIKFEGGVMQVPSLSIEDRTETFFRNLIAYEQYRPSNKPSPLSDYARFLDCLINTPKDVQILSSLGIIDNWMGDDEVVSAMFNKITDGVGMADSFQYASMFNRVNDHCSRRWNRWMATLKRDYFNTPWAWISVLAADVALNPKRLPDDELPSRKT